ATFEFLEGVRRVLRPDGAVVSNLWSTSPDHPAMVATYLATFGTVQMVRVGRTIQRILVAAPAAGFSRGELVDEVERLQRQVDLGFDLAAMVRRGYEGTPLPMAEPLRDP